MSIFLLFIGLAILWLGAELIIRGATEIAEHYKLSHLFIGLTILAIGTDLPETFIVITGAFQQTFGIQNSGIIVGEIVGSTLSQITLVLGIAGLFGLITISKRALRRDGSMLLLAILMFFLIVFDGHITITESILMIMVYSFYMYSLFYGEKIFAKVLIRPSAHMLTDVLSIVAGFILLVFASHITLTQSILISEQWGIAQTWVGIIIVGLGTSLPELVTSITAVRRKVGGMAIGNMLGSNIYDLLIPLSLGSLITRFKVDSSLINFDIPVLLICSITALFFFRRDGKLIKSESAVLITLYILYFTYTVFKLF